MQAQGSPNAWITLALILLMCCLFDASIADHYPTTDYHDNSQSSGHYDGTVIMQGGDSSLQRSSGTAPAASTSAGTDSATTALASSEELSAKFSICETIQRCDLCVKPHLVRGINPFTDVEHCIWDKITHTCRSATLPWEKSKYDCETYCRGANALLTSLPQALFPHRLCEIHVCPYVASVEVCPTVQDQSISRSIVAEPAYLGDPNAMDRLTAMHLLGKALLPRLRDARDLYRHAAATFIESASMGGAGLGADSELTISKSALRHATSVNAHVSRGIRDAIGGLAYSIAKNLFNRVRLSDCDANYRRRDDIFGYYLNAARRCSAIISSGSAKGCRQWQAMLEAPSKCDTDFPSPKTVVYTSGEKIKRKYRRAAARHSIEGQLAAGREAFQLVTDKEKAAGDSELLAIAGFYALAQTAPPGILITHVVEHFGSSTDTYQKPEDPSPAGGVGGGGILRGIGRLFRFAETDESSGILPFLRRKGRWGKWAGGARKGRAGGPKKKMLRTRALHEHHYLLVGASEPHHVEPSVAASAQHAFIIDFWAAVAGGPKYAVHDIPFTVHGDAARAGVSRSALEELSQAAKGDGVLPPYKDGKKPAKIPAKDLHRARVSPAFGMGVDPSTDFADGSHSPHVARHNLKRARRLGASLRTGHYRGGSVSGLSPATAGSSSGEGSHVIRSVVTKYTDRGNRERYAVRVKHERILKRKSTLVATPNAKQSRFQKRLQQERLNRIRERMNWLRRWKQVRMRQGLPTDPPTPPILLEAGAAINEDAVAERAYLAYAQFKAQRADQSLREYLNSIYGFDTRRAAKAREALALNRALLEEELSGSYTVTAWQDRVRAAANVSLLATSEQRGNEQLMQEAQDGQLLLSNDVLREIALNLDKHVNALMTASLIGDVAGEELENAQPRLLNKFEQSANASAVDSKRVEEIMQHIMAPAFAHVHSPSSNARDLELAASLLAGGSTITFQHIVQSPVVHDAQGRVFALINDAARIVKLVRTLQIVQQELDTPGSTLEASSSIGSGSATNFDLNEFLNTKTDVFAEQHKRKQLQAQSSRLEPAMQFDSVHEQARSMLKELWRLPDANARRLELSRRAAFAEQLYHKVRREFSDLVAEAGLPGVGTAGLMSLLESSANSHPDRVGTEGIPENAFDLAEEIAEVEADLQELNSFSEVASLVEASSEVGMVMTQSAQIAHYLQQELAELRAALAEEQESEALRLEEREKHTELVAQALHGEEGQRAIKEAAVSLLSLPEQERMRQARAAEAELAAQLNEERETLRKQWLAWIHQDQQDLEAAVGDNLTPAKVLQAVSKWDLR